MPAKAKASAHPGGLVDLSVGTPVDPVPGSIQRALAEAANSPGYPFTAGSPALREAISAWLTRTLGPAPGFGVLPSIGLKELVAWLPTLLGLGPQDIVVLPEVCYPTYEVGARLAGASVERRPVAGANRDRQMVPGQANQSFAPTAGPPCGGLRESRPAHVADVYALGTRGDEQRGQGPSDGLYKLVWVNSPSNPTGRVMSSAELNEALTWAREHGAVIASDECYISLPWTARPVSILEVCDGDYTGVLSLHSLSKRSNMAGYRAGFVAGDPALIEALLEVRKHAGMIMPAPVQAAMIAALGDESHVETQRALYGARREILMEAVLKAGFTVEHSEAGLYLWLTRGEDCWSTVDWFAERGILVAPGDFYGPAGGRHVRVALTATDERVNAAAARLT